MAYRNTSGATDAITATYKCGLPIYGNPPGRARLAGKTGGGTAHTRRVDGLRLDDPRFLVESAASARDSYRRAIDRAVDWAIRPSAERARKQGESERLGGRG